MGEGRRPGVSAVLCTFNEDRHLAACLDSLAWADEIIVCDMGSSDGTEAIVRERRCRWVPIPRVNCVEKVRAQVVALCEHDWVCFMDPDTVFPAGRIDAVHGAIASRPDVTCINMYSVNHYCGKPVLHGFWGVGSRACVFRRDAMSLPQVLHNGFVLTRGEAVTLPRDITLKHMWVDSRAHFLAKHTRYIQEEGRARLAQGVRPSLRRTARRLVRGCLIYARDGFRDGLLGINLLGLCLWYEWSSERALGQEWRRSRAVDPDP